MTRKQVKMFTDEQYLALIDVLNGPHGSYKSYQLENSINWVWCSGVSASRMSKRENLAFLRLPLEMMPLYINDINQRKLVIAIWRLKIAR
jgi:hypothetical protein